MRLYEIYRQLLAENRIPVIKDKLGPKLQAKLDSDPSTGASSDEFVDKVAGFDPSKQKKYTQWMLANYLKGTVKAEDLYKTSDYITKFEKHKKKLDKKDINQYTPATLYAAVKDFSDEEPEYNDMTDKQRKKHIDKTSTEGMKLIASGTDAKIYQPTTKAAACKLGTNTQWCTATRSDDNMFDYYNEQGPLYVVIGADGEKYQLQFENNQYMDKNDEPVVLAELENKYPTIKPITQAYKDELIKTKDIEKIMMFVHSDEDNEGTTERWPEAEPYIMKDPNGAYVYARNVIKGRWPEAEPYIMKDPNDAFLYARDVINGRWPEAEPYIMKDPESAYAYAHSVIKGRWPEAEPYIMKDPESAYRYAENVIKGRWPEAEPYIMKDPESAYRYAIGAIKGEWHKAEPFIMKDPTSAFLYARDVINGRWPEAEPYIMKDPESAYRYAVSTIRGRWPEAEPYIKQNKWAWKTYTKFVEEL